MINRSRIGFQEGGNPRFAGGYRPEQISFDDWLRGKISGGSDKYGYLKNISKKYGYNLADALDLLYKYEIEHPKNLAEDPNYSINRLDGEDFYKMQFKTLEESGAAAQQNPEQEKYMLEQGYDAILKNYGLLDSTSKFPTIDPFTGKPYGIDPNAPVQPVGPAPPDNYYDEVPTIDPFSGQQVSAQDQAACTQPQNIFPQQELPTVQPEAPFQPYQAEPSNVGIFVGPSFDKYSAARTDAYANAPSKFDYDVTANQAAGQFIQDRAREIYGDNIFGKGIGTLGAVAGVPIAMFASPFHEAAQVITQGRMKPGSGIEGFYKAFMNELPFSTAANRAAGVMKSIPGVGEPIYQGAYKLGEGLANLTSRDPVLSSLTKNFNNLTLQEMDKIRNTSREKLIEQARSAGQEGGMGYLLGF